MFSRSLLALGLLLCAPACVPPPVLRPSCTDDCSNYTQPPGVGGGVNSDGGSSTQYPDAPIPPDAMRGYDAGGLDGLALGDATTTLGDATTTLDTSSGFGPDF